MANGKVLTAYKASIERGDTVPQNVTNGVILTALTELYEMVEGIRASLDVSAAERKVEAERNKDVVRGHSLWNDFGKEIIRFLILAILGYIALRLGLVQ